MQVKIGDFGLACMDMLSNEAEADVSTASPSSSSKEMFEKVNNIYKTPKNSKYDCFNWDGNLIKK